MKPVKFDYLPARDGAEAVRLLTEHGDEAKCIAGGQSLGPMLNLRLARPAVLVDLHRAEADRQQDVWVEQEKAKVRRRRREIEEEKTTGEKVMRGVARRIDKLKDSRNLRFNKLYRQKFDPVPWVFFAVGLLFYWMVNNRVWPFSHLIDGGK